MRALLISSTTKCLANDDWERTTDSNQCTTRWIWRNKGIPPRCGHFAHDGRRLPLADHQGCHILGRWLFVRLQCHPWLSYSEFMESRNFNLPPDDQVSYRVRSRGGIRGLSISTWVLHRHARDGWSFTNHVCGRTADSGKAHGRVVKGTSRWLQA